MRTIYKYPLSIKDEIKVRMPHNAQVLTIQVQHDVPCIWAMVDTAAEKVTRKFAVRGTGHDCQDMPANAFVGTFQMHGGALVFHLFDLGER